MFMDKVISRRAEKSPVTVMARLALERALKPAWLDELIEREADTQYQRAAIFNDGGADVAGGSRPAAIAPRCSPSVPGVVGVDTGTVRQGRTHRAALDAGIGSRQRRAPHRCIDADNQGQDSSGIWLPTAYRRGQSSAGKRKADQAVVRLYRHRWKIESMFQRLESVLHNEVISLGHLRAALLAFGVAVLTYNVLTGLRSAVRAAHDLRDSGIELSPFYVATEVREHDAGMMMAIAEAT